MVRLFSLISGLLMSYLPSLIACDGCKEPSDVTGASGAGGIGASFSWSVLFMIGMLAFLLSGMVLMMVRSCKQLAAQRSRIPLNSADRIQEAKNSRSPAAEVFGHAEDPLKGFIQRPSSI
jgi:hypothetical protein